MSNIVEIKRQSLRNVPEKLRDLAAAIEAGTHGDVTSALVLIPVAGDVPMAFGFGDQDGDRHPVVVCEMAKVWFVTRQVTR